MDFETTGAWPRGVETTGGWPKDVETRWPTFCYELCQFEFIGGSYEGEAPTQYELCTSVHIWVMSYDCCGLL